MCADTRNKLDGGRGGGDGGVGLGGGGGRAVTIKDSIKDLSKLTLCLGDGGGYLSEVEVHGEDEHGEIGGGGGLGGGGGRAVTKDLSKLFFLLGLDDGGYLSGGGG